MEETLAHFAEGPVRVSGTAGCGQRPQLLPLGPCGTPFQPEAATGRSAPGWRVLTCILLALLCLARGPSEQRRLQRKEWPRARPAWGAGGRALSGCRHPAGIGQSCAEATPCCCRGRPGWAVPATGQAADAMAAPGGDPVDAVRGQAVGTERQGAAGPASTLPGPWDARWPREADSGVPGPVAHNSAS